MKKKVHHENGTSVTKTKHEGNNRPESGKVKEQSASSIGTTVATTTTPVSAIDQHSTVVTSVVASEPSEPPMDPTHPDEGYCGTDSVSPGLSREQSVLSTVSRPATSRNGRRMMINQTRSTSRMSVHRGKDADQNDVIGSPPQTAGGSRLSPLDQSEEERRDGEGNKEADVLSIKSYDENEENATLAAESPPVDLTPRPTVGVRLSPIQSSAAGSRNGDAASVDPATGTVNSARLPPIA